MLFQSRQLFFRGACKVGSITGVQNNYSTIGNPAATAANSSTTTVASQWQAIYHFHFIKAIAGLNKLKIYQAALTSAAVPVSMGLEVAEQLPTGSAEMVGVLGL